MSLPGKGVEVPLTQIQDICAYFGLTTLWQKNRNGSTLPLPFRWMFVVVQQVEGV